MKGVITNCTSKYPSYDLRLVGGCNSGQMTPTVETIIPQKCRITAGGPLQVVIWIILRSGWSHYNALFIETELYFYV